MAAQVDPVEIGCQPSPSIPAETVLANGYVTYLLFFASTASVDESNLLRDLGVAILNCRECTASKFGYPNDEGLPEHPFYNDGMSDSTASAFVVTDSPWVKEIQIQRDASWRRIWKEGRGYQGAPLPDDYRHFVIPLKEKTFECLAKEIVVERFEPSFDKAFDYVISRMNEY